MLFRSRPERRLEGAGWCRVVPGGAFATPRAAGWRIGGVLAGVARYPFGKAPQATRPCQALVWRVLAGASWRPWRRPGCLAPRVGWPPRFPLNTLPWSGRPSGVMSVPKLILHVGTGKTGTTSIQVALSRNQAALAELGYHVVEIGRAHV